MAEGLFTISVRIEVGNRATRIVIWLLTAYFMLGG